MGMIACYMEADDSLIEEMKNKVTEEIMESIEELGEEGELEVNDIDSALAAFCRWILLTIGSIRQYGRKVRRKVCVKSCCRNLLV